MSSDEDDVALQKQKDKLTASLTRAAAQTQSGIKGSRRQSRETPPVRLSQSTSSSRQSTKDSLPSRKAAASAAVIEDSDDDARLMQQPRLLSAAKVHLQPSITLSARHQICWS